MINDKIHGMIRLPGYTSAVIATPLFQRLRRIKQLGNLGLAWPSATYTRFEHSLGTAHLAALFAAHLELTPRETKALVLAALLHDVAHGPYSHTFEVAIEGTVTHKRFKSHDHYRLALIERNRELRAALDASGSYADVRAVWTRTPTAGMRVPLLNELLNELLEGDGGVDRMDYLHRDSETVQPQRKLHCTCWQSIMLASYVDEHGALARTVEGDRYLGHLLAERAYLHREVYKHPRAVAGDELLKKAFRLGLEAVVQPMVDVEAFVGLDDAFIEQAWRDERLACVPECRAVLVAWRDGKVVPE